MLEEYIIAQQQQVDTEIRSLKERLQNLCDEEASEAKRMDQLISNEDVGLELFSPRNLDTKLKQRLQKIKEHIDEIQYEQNAITEEIDRNIELESKWKELLKQAKEQSERKETSDPVVHKPEDPQEDTFRNGNAFRQEKVTRFQNEMDILLNRVDHCIALLHANRTDCEKELQNIKYYIMALRSSDSA